MVALTPCLSIQQPDSNVNYSLGPRSNDQMSSRDELVVDINALRDNAAAGNNRSLLIIITLVDNRAYDNIVRIFGFNVAEIIKTVRIEALRKLGYNCVLYDVGHWSIATLFFPSKTQTLDIFLKELVEELSAPIICRGVPVRIKTGVGVCDLARCHGASEDVLQLAYSASKVGVASASGWAESRYDLESGHRRTFSLVADLDHSLAGNSEFDVYYQPRQTLKDSTFSNAEALLRWNHPNLGVVPPAEIVPVAEMTGQIRALTRFVLTQAIRDAKKWHQRGIMMSVSVNISPLNLEEEDFVEQLGRLLSSFEFDGSYLDLELSELRLPDDITDCVRQMNAIREIGVDIAIDDFGASGRNFSYLPQLPVKHIKLDSSLLRLTNANPSGGVILRSCIELAHNLGIETVAEGVESKKILKQLALLGCDFAQGFCIEEPMNSDEFGRWTIKAFPSLGRSAREHEIGSLIGV